MEEEKLKINIQPMQYQYAEPKKYEGKTKGAEYIVTPEWHKYYAVEMYKNYFIEDEFDFLKAFKQDLEQQLLQLNELIDKEERLYKKRK